MTFAPNHTNTHTAVTPMVTERPVCIRMAKRGEGQPDIGWVGGIPE